MDWHAEVYGARAGGHYHDFFDLDEEEADASPSGSRAVISDASLRRLGGPAYFRAHEVLDKHRMSDMKVRENAAILILSGRVHSNYALTPDYRVEAQLDQDARQVANSSCTCQAFGRQGLVCKHCIALIMAYEEEPDRFEHLITPGVHGRRTGRTTPELSAYMTREDQTRRRSYRDRQLQLLREVGNRAESGAEPIVDRNRHMPIGSVRLRPSLEGQTGGWKLRLRITMPSRKVSYLVKDIPALLRAVDQAEFVSYGSKLAFVHSRDTFDQPSKTLLSLVGRAEAIRRSLTTTGNSFHRHGSRSSLDCLVLTADETVQLLDIYEDSGLTLDYAPSDGYLYQTMPTKVIGGDPDLGISIRPDSSTAHSHRGYLIGHTHNVEEYIGGQSAAYVITRPVSPGNAQDPSPCIYRCSSRFIKNHRLLEILCADQEGDNLYLDAHDLDLFSRTVLPELEDAGAEGDVNSSGLMVSLPEDLLRLRRPPCQIEIYLDRDREGISCDLQARYGQQSYSVLIDRPSKGDSIRDQDLEKLAQEAIRQYFPPPQEGVCRIPETDDRAIYTLLTQGLPLLRGVGQIFSTPAFDGLTVTSHTQIRVGVSLRSGLVEISPIADEIDPDEVPEILAHYRKRRRFHRLRNGAFIDLTSLDASRVGEAASDLGISRASLDAGHVTVPAYQSYYLDSQIGHQDQDIRFRSYMDGLKTLDPHGYRPPRDFHGELRPYQLEGFRWLNALADQGFGGILADEMGLGKTVQMLAFLLFRHHQPSDGHSPSLIICPASLVYNWAEESHRFTPGLKVGILSGSKADRRALLAGATDYDLLITSYDLLRRDIEDCRQVSWDCLILDEAQYIKNHATKISRAVRSLSSFRRFALTGTPVENRLSELWSIFDFLMPGLLGSYAHFRDRFEMPILSGDKEAQSGLQALVSHFILRRLKSQVLPDLPEKIENVITVPLEGRQRKLYSALEQELRSTLNHEHDREYEEGKIQVLAQLTRLRQICCDPRLVYQTNLSGGGESGSKTNLAGRQKEVSRGESAKLDAIEELVVSCQDAGRKMLIFSQFTSFLDLIAQRLGGIGVEYDLITGSTPKKRRLDLVAQFNKDLTPVFLISLKAGNTGLNLTGACVVIQADPWWNAAAQEQANDRAHRIGQTQDVNVYQIVAKDTIEERILALQRSKNDLASRFVDSASVTRATDISTLSREDLLTLLGK